MDAKLRRNNNPFTRWLKERGFWVHANNKDDKTTRRAAPFTHVFLDGGKAVVPAQAWDESYEKYADAVVAGFPQFAVECAPKKHMRMFVDVDTKHLPSDHAVDPREKELDIVKTVLDAARVRYDGILTQGAVVCMKRNEPDGRLGGGIHIVWQGDRAVVTHQEALSMRNDIVAGCVLRAQHYCDDKKEKEKEKEKDAWWKEIPWNDLVDQAVYKTASLRMIFARKRDSSSVYVPAFFSPPLSSFCLQHDEKEDDKGDDALQAISPEDISLDMARWVKRASVYPPSSLFKVAGKESASSPSADDPFLGDGEVRHERREGDRRKGEREREGAGGGGGGGGGAGISHALLESGEVDPEKIEELRTALPEPYRSSCMLTGIRKNVRSGSYVISTNSRFCMNKGAEHTSNHVYFVAKKDGVFQRCFNTSDTTEGRRYGQRCCELDLKICDGHPLPCLKAEAEKQAKEDRARNIDKRVSFVPTPSFAADAWLDKILLPTNTRTSTSTSQKQNKKRKR